MSRIEFEVYHLKEDNLFCPKCGERYKLVESSVLGVRIVSEDGNEDAYISIEELKKLLR